MIKLNIFSGSSDPTSVAVAADSGSLYYNTTNSSVYAKTDDGLTTNWVLLGTAATGNYVPGDAARWSSPAPSLLCNAIDRLAASVTNPIS